VLVFTTDQISNQYIILRSCGLWKLVKWKCVEDTFCNSVYIFIWLNYILISLIRHISGGIERIGSVTAVDLVYQLKTKKVTALQQLLLHITDKWLDLTALLECCNIDAYTTHNCWCLGADCGYTPEITVPWLVMILHISQSVSTTVITLFNICSPSCCTPAVGSVQFSYSDSCMLWCNKLFMIGHLLPVV